mgnify:CR=1 FL=1
MGLSVVPEQAWFEIDALYPAEMAEKYRLLTERRAEVFATTPGSEAACAEALAMVVANLTTHRPNWFSQAGSVLTTHLTGEIWDLPAADHPATPGPLAP